MVHVRVVPADRLQPEDRAAWARIRQAAPEYLDPFLSPAFTQAVAEVRGDVEVALLSENEQGPTMGFFPFQRSGMNIGKPVGGRLCGCQAVIAAPELNWTPVELVRGCGLAAWDFDHLLTHQSQFQPYYWQTEIAPYIDLSDGFEGYRRRRTGAGCTRIQKTMAHARRLERHVARIHFDLHTLDIAALHALFRWKSMQFRRTGLTDVFAFDWVRQMIQHIVENSTDECGALLSVLYAGPRRIAISLALRSGSTAHGWFTAYDREFARYSPGSILLLRIAQAAPSMNITKWKLGKGNDRYKLSFMSSSTQLAEGSVELAPWVKIVRRGWRWTRNSVRRSSFHRVVRHPAGMVRRFREYLELR